MSMTNEGAMAPLPQYQSHKKVHALKIGAIEFDQEGIATLAVEEPFLTIILPVSVSERFKKAIGENYDDAGYYVLYEDGYQSWSPTKAFEEGYTKM